LPPGTALLIGAGGLLGIHNTQAMEAAYDQAHPMTTACATFQTERADFGASEAAYQQHWSRVAPFIAAT
jgi:hypothetical protein